MGILACTVVYQRLGNALADGLREHYVLDSPSAAAYAAWSDSDAPGGPDIVTDFYVYHIENPWEVSCLGATTTTTTPPYFPR